ncbi:MAG: haloalkane dehalogenase [Pseudomonadota bacterium]
MSKSLLVTCTLLILISVTVGCSGGSNNNGIAENNQSATEASNSAPQDACRLPIEEITVSATEAGIEYVRTPDECFNALVNYPFEPNYAVVDGLRVHYVDAGPEDGEVVLMLHGQPSWSYLYRKMIPVLVDAGYRVIAPDHIGMGRSDKPTDPRVHIYDQQVQWNKQFVTQLGLSNITLFVQDWGSLIGLRVAGEMPELFARIVVANGTLPTIPPGLNPFTVPVFEFDETAPGAEEFFATETGDFAADFQAWIDYAATAPELFAADVVQLISLLEIPENELSAYDAPFPDPLYWGAIRAFPSMIAGVQGQTLPAYAALGQFDRPFLFLAGEFDENLGSVGNQNSWIAHVPGAEGQDHRRYEAAHFIQEDVGAELAAQLVEFMQLNPIAEAGPLFNFRYCEILLLKEAETDLVSEVYNTMLTNSCPQEAWDAIDLDAVAEEQGALEAIANGPKYWVMDLQQNLAEEDSQIPGFGTVVTFGELDMTLLGSFPVSEGSSAEPAPYDFVEVSRTTRYTYVAGRRIYELVDAEGRRYVMQSMSQQIDPQLQLHDLVRLDERLDLPAGWTFSTRILPDTLFLDTDGVAIVVSDEFYNSYQRLE